MQPYSPGWTKDLKPFSLRVQMVADSKLLPHKTSPGRARLRKTEQESRWGFVVFVGFVWFCFPPRECLYVQMMSPTRAPQNCCAAPGQPSFQDLPAAVADVSVPAPPWGTSRRAAGRKTHRHMWSGECEEQSRSSVAYKPHISRVYWHGLQIKDGAWVRDAVLCSDVVNWCLRVAVEVSCGVGLSTCPECHQAQKLLCWAGDTVLQAWWHKLNSPQTKAGRWPALLYLKKNESNLWPVRNHLRLRP